MNTEHVNPTLLAWLEEGPTAGPESALSAALVRVETTVQRPALLAGLNAGGIATGRAHAGSRPMWILATMLLLAVLLAGLALASLGNPSIPDGQVRYESVYLREDGTDLIAVGISGSGPERIITRIAGGAATPEDVTTYPSGPALSSGGLLAYRGPDPNGTDRVWLIVDLSHPVAAPLPIVTGNGTSVTAVKASWGPRDQLALLGQPDNPDPDQVLEAQHGPLYFVDGLTGQAHEVVIPADVMPSVDMARGLSLIWAADGSGILALGGGNSPGVLRTDGSFAPGLVLPDATNTGRLIRADGLALLPPNTSFRPHATDQLRTQANPDWQGGAFHGGRVPPPTTLEEMPDKFVVDYRWTADGEAIWVMALTDPASVSLEQYRIDEHRFVPIAALELPEGDPEALLPPADEPLGGGILAISPDDSSLWISVNYVMDGGTWTSREVQYTVATGLFTESLGEVPWGWLSSAGSQDTTAP